MDPLMTLWVFVIGSLFGIIIGVLFSYRTAVAPLQYRLEKNRSQLMELHDSMKYYPYDLDNFRFIGSPVDGIQFEHDRVLFIQVSKQNVPSTKDQDHIRTLVENGKVAWFEFMTR